jgi:protein phosphatase 2C family protein 2/3
MSSPLHQPAAQGYPTGGAGSVSTSASAPLLGGGASAGSGTAGHALDALGQTSVPLRTLVFHLALFLGSCAVILLALSHVNVWCAGLAWLLAMKLGAMRFPSLVVSSFGIAGANDAVAEALRRCDTMPQPNQRKTTHTGSGGSDVVFACSSMQGWRRSMEDAHSTVLDLRHYRAHHAGGHGHASASDAASASAASGKPANSDRNDAGSGGDGANGGAAGSSGADAISFFAVFDGHSGSTIAQFCGDMLPEFVAATEAFRAGRYQDALRDAYIGIDKHLSQHPKLRDDRSGCTAVSLLVTATEVVCANAGDSRCVLCRRGVALPLSIDHKPTLPGEKRRIERAKSFVQNRRVNGVLALSRALGDFSFKRRPFIPWEEQAVTCVPEIIASPIERDADEFVVVACDGIWDVMSNDAVVAFVRSRLLRGVHPNAVCEMLMDACLSTSPFGLGCDNMSVIIVLLRGTHKLGHFVDKELGIPASQSPAASVGSDSDATPALAPSGSPAALVGAGSLAARSADGGNASVLPPAGRATATLTGDPPTSASSGSASGHES